MQKLGAYRYRCKPSDVENAFELNVSISEDELNRGVWLEKIKAKKMTKLLVVNMENISYTEQEKFARLLKDRRVVQINCRKIYRLLFLSGAMQY